MRPPATSTTERVQCKFTVYKVQCTLYSVRCIVYSVQYSVQYRIAQSKAELVCPVHCAVQVYLLRRDAEGRLQQCPAHALGARRRRERALVRVEARAHRCTHTCAFTDRDVDALLVCSESCVCVLCHCECTRLFLPLARCSPTAPGTRNATPTSEMFTLQASECHL